MNSKLDQDLHYEDVILYEESTIPSLPDKIYLSDGFDSIIDLNQRIGELPNFSLLEEEDFKFINVYSEDEEIKPDLRKPDNNIEDLHKEAIELLNDAQTQYKQLGGKGLIKVHSGVRDCFSQARLFWKYVEYQYGGPSANKANPPGKSLHHFGIAIDVIRGSDETRIAEALRVSGWHDSIEDEGWHFVAISISSYQDIVDRVKKECFPMANKYRDLVSDYFQFGRYIEENEPEAKQENIRLSSEKAWLRSEYRNLVEMEHVLSDSRNELNAIVERMANQREKLLSLRREIDNLDYQNPPRCPKGLPFDDCEHTNRKHKFKSEERILQNRYRKEYNIYMKLNKQYKKMRDTYNQDSLLLRNRYNEYKLRRDNYNDDLKELNKLLDKIQKWKENRKKRKNDAEKLLPKIQLAVNEIRNTKPSAKPE